jgi:hypothetical protein
MLEHTEEKLKKANHHNQGVTHLAKNYLSILNNFIFGYKTLVGHFKPCFKGLS